MSGMCEYVGTARTFWVPWLTARGWGRVVWGEGSGSEGGWRHCGAWSGCGRMLKAVEACSDHIWSYPRTFINPGRQSACDPGQRDGSQATSDE